MSKRKKKLYVIWRIDGEFTLSILKKKYRFAPTNELIKLCIKDPKNNYSEEEIEFLIGLTTDYDNPDFIGYEMPVIFVSSDVIFF